MKPKRKESFEDWFARLGVRHFSAGEFTRYFAKWRGKVQNEAPPRELWEEIVPTLRLVDDLRAHFGQPITLLSSYRSPRYNSAVGGASRSLHKRFMALDISIKGVGPKRVAAKLKEWRRAGRFKGGIGTYRAFVHVDNRGYAATW